MMKNLQHIQLFPKNGWANNTKKSRKQVEYFFVLLLLLSFSVTSNAQHCGGTPSVLAKWDFNTETVQCNGAENFGPTPITNPSITPGATYCPNVNNGCAPFILGSVGHQNTPQFQNAICLANFYNVEYLQARGAGAPYDPNSSTFDPNGKANLSVWFSFPKNKSGCLTSFQLKVLQKQFNGTQLNFEKQGVAVKRNGVVIYSETQNITAANINGTPFTFTFTGSQFCSDGSEDVEFEIVYGLVKRLIGPAMPGTPGQTGYDDICVNGYCQELTFGGIIPATCGTSGPNNDAKVLIQNFAPGNRYDYVQGETYTGSATYAAGSTAVPADGIIPNFPNPVSPTKYTFRVFQENCFSDFTVTHEPKYCCLTPTGSQLVVVPATCNGTTANSDAQIKLLGVSGGTKAGISAGTSYSGPDFASASTLTGGAFTFASLPNPLVSQIYTIRVFTDATCYLDLQTTLFNKSCVVPCTPPNSATLSSVKATCNGTTKNADASITVTNVNGGDRVGMSPSINYSGPDYATATPLVNGSYTFTGINTPNGTQIYTVRIYNTSDGCYIDKTVEIADAECGPCKHPSAFVISAGPNLCEANGANNQSAFESCKTNGFIDLELTKTVDPSTGITCATSGTSFVWTLTIQNKGTMTATNVNVVDLIPAGLSITATNTAKGAYYGNSGWDVGSLAANETATLTITTIALKAGSYTNCAYVNKAFPENDPDSSPNNRETANEDDDACASITVTGNNAPTIEKSFSSVHIKPNTPTRMTIKITNNASVPITLTGNLVDEFPSTPAQMVVAATPNVQSSAGITLPPAGITAVAGATSITLPTGTVLAPGLNQFSVDITVPSLGNYCNSIAKGALKTDIGENCLETEACLVVNPVFQTPPIVTKSMTPAVIQSGQTSTLTVKIENKNGLPMTLNQIFVDKIPAGLTVNGTISSSCGGATLRNSNTEIAVAAGTVIAANSTCTISVTVTASATGQYCNTIIANAISTTVGTDTELGNEEIAQGCLKVQGPCTKPILSLGTPVCDGNGKYSVSFSTSAPTVTPSSGTVSGNKIIGINIGTNLTVTAGTGNDCQTTLTAQSPAACPVPSGCTLPTLGVGQPICNGTTYTVAFVSTAAVISTAGTVSGNTIINIPLGTDITITASNAANCQTKVDVKSPTNCAVSCENPGISVSLPTCDANGATTYSVNYVLSTGASISTSVGTITANSITGVPNGTDLIITIKQTNCPDRILTISNTLVNCVQPKGSLGDFVWKDTNNNGIQDETTPNNGGVAGVQIELYKNGTLFAKDTTDATGKYLFTNLDAGTYKIKVLSASIPANCEISSLKDAPSDDAKDSDVDKTTGESGNYEINPLDPTKKDILTVDAALVTTCVKPTWTVTSPPTCAQNNQTYSVTFTVTGKNGTIKANGVPLTGSSPYTVTVQSGKNLVLTDSLSANCKFDTTIAAPNCGCPIAAPVAVAPSVNICEGDAIPTLSVSVVQGATANWYSSQTGGQPLASGTLTYRPASAGTFWVEAVVTGPQGCVSTSRTPVQLTITLVKCVPATIRKIIR